MLFRNLNRKLDHAIGLLYELKLKVDTMARTLDETLAAVTDESTKTDSLIALFNGVEQQLKDVLAGAALPPSVQAKIDAIFDGVTNNAAKVQASLDANTPPA